MEQKEPKNPGFESTGEEEKVIALAKERGAVTRKEVEILLGIGQTTCGRLLRQMIGHGLIVQEGKGKNTHYCLPK
jgi:ATP-dependent DNA helicase RecG